MYPEAPQLKANGNILLWDAVRNFKLREQIGKVGIILLGIELALSKIAVDLGSGAEADYFVPYPTEISTRLLLSLINSDTLNFISLTAEEILLAYPLTQATAMPDKVALPCLDGRKASISDCLRER